MVLKGIVHAEMDLLTLMLFQTCIMLFFNEAQKKKLKNVHAALLPTTSCSRSNKTKDTL